MENKRDIELEVKRFIKSKVGLEVDDNTLIFDELGIDGLDASTFMESLSSHFKVDISSYDFRKYHFAESEIFNPFLIIIDIFRFKRLHNFKVSHLYEVIEKGSWFDPTS
ncbi:MAG: DUF1493 family protein [Bacteroidota bacterium]